MTELSSAAEAVLDAALPHQVHRYAAAAALRAAADHMSSHHSKAYLYSLADALKLKAIAAELEAQ